jgi:hypothetical protein
MKMANIKKKSKTSYLSRIEVAFRPSCNYCSRCARAINTREEMMHFKPLSYKILLFVLRRTLHRKQQIEDLVKCRLPLRASR